MADSINNKAKEYYDNDDTGGSLNNNLKDFLKQQGAEGNSLNTLWRNYAYGEGGNSLNTRLGKLWGTSGSLIKRWKDVLGLTWDDLKLFFNARRNDPELLLSGATSFDGTGDYIQLASDGTGKFNKQNFTISAWVKISDNGWNPIFSYDFTSHASPYYALSVLSVATDSFLSMRLNNNGSNFEVVTSESIPVNVWTHIAVSNTNGSQKLYINGLLKKSATNTATITYYNQEVWVGKNNFATINGSISSLGFWERVLSASEIESIYWKGQYTDLKGTELTNLISWYNLSADANDSTGTNNGTNNGATFLTDAYSASSPFLPRIQDKASDTVVNYGEIYGGNAVSFDGVNDYINLGDDADLSFGDDTNDFPFTFSAWVNADDLSDFPIIAKGVYNSTAEYSWMFNGSDQLRLEIYDDSNSTYESARTDALTSFQGKWTHCVVTYDGRGGTSANQGIALYINGSAQSLTLAGAGTYGAMKDKGADAYIGRANTTYGDGKINNVQIFNTVLTQDQVRELYTKPELTLPTGIASSALKLDMPMQEGSGTAILDGSGNQNHGTGSGITWATGQEYAFQHPLVRSNNPMVFDGADDKVTVGTPSALNNIFTGGGTLSAWINPKSDGQNNAGQAFDKGKYTFQVISESSGSVKVQFAVTLSGGAARWETPRSVSLNNWTHILVTYDSDNPTTDPIIYLNGSAVSLTETISPSGTYVSDATSNLILGNRNDGVTTFDGLLNDLAIWGSALTANEVTALYNSGLPLLPTTDSGNYASADDLVGYWRNDGVTTWLDRSTNSNNGTVSGSPASIIVPERLNEGRDSQGYYLTDTDSISSGIRLKGAEYIDVGKSEAYPFKGGQNVPFSVEVWVKINDLTALNGVIGNSGECFYIRLLSSGRIEVFLKGSGGGFIKQEVSSVTSAGWHHLCVTYDGSGNRDNINIFWDSAEQSNAPSSSGTYTSLNTTANNLQIGTINGSSYLKGSLDEIRIYDKVLSNAEILKNYNNGKSAHSN